ncbi:tRNA dihydrouridine synthase DusB [Utexia brackfieldae]|uniref:tRNA dihydrouridine synthase DusB n=1 Tax=Utexia brackfieldae TaxID=3074108 RepID=UPI00370D0D29
MKIGNLELKSRLIAAPMAGISDRAFRSLCCQMGAAMAVSEMLLANPDLWHTDKSALRMASKDENHIRAVQIVGADPQEMANAAQLCAASGAQLIDINMGCPAKKVNKKLAGSALLQYPILVEQILSTVVKSVDIPVTLKIRTGWNKDNINCLEIAKIAEGSGISALTIHGRTRACLFNGEAEYDSIRSVKQHINIPVIANGDITSPEKAKAVLEYTGADGLMIGRCAQGNPWIFEQIEYYLRHGKLLQKKSLIEKAPLINDHVRALHNLYGEYKGLRIARKHVSWYLQDYAQSEQFRRLFNAIDNAEQQFIALEAFFSTTHLSQKS